MWTLPYNINIETYEISLYISWPTFYPQFVIWMSTLFQDSIKASYQKQMKDVISAQNFSSVPIIFLSEVKQVISYGGDTL